MKPVKVEGDKVTFADKGIEKEKQRQVKLAAFADKKKQGKLTLEDVDAKLDAIIDMLTNLAAK